MHLRWLESVSWLADLVDASGEVVNGLLPDGTIVYWSPASERLYGYTAAEVVGRPITIIQSPEDRAGLPALLERLARGEAVVRRRTTRISKDGRRIPVELTVHAVNDASGGLVGVCSLARDVSDLVAAEAELHERRRFLESAQAVAHLGSWQAWLDGSGRAIWSPESYRIMGLEPGTPVTPAAFFGALPPEDRAAHEAASAGLSREGCFTLEHRIRRPGGELRWVRSHGRMMNDDAGHDVLVGTIQDITEQRELEQQLRQALRLEAVGQLAGGVAHDFNNLLTPILTFAELLRDGLAPGDPRIDDVDEIRKAAERAAGLTRQLLAFSRQQPIDPRVVDLNTVVEDLGKMLRRLLGEHLEVRTNLHEGLGRVLADPGQLEQVIVNLAVNARDAMPDGGMLLIETANVELDEAHARHHGEARPGPHVMLAVTDTGTGMAPETLARIFEPFFTTKERGRGTGLGLSTVYGIVRRSGGHIDVQTEPGRGTAFRVYLPRHAQEPLAAQDRAERQAAPSRGETILLVDDDDGVRRAVRNMLRRAGYIVLEARSGAEALGVAAQHPGRIDLLLTDVVMPGLPGPALAADLVRARPATKVIFMSGYTEDTELLRVARRARAAFLQKPLTPELVRGRIRAALDAA